MNSISSISTEDNIISMSSEGSSSCCPDDSHLELGLALSLGFRNTDPKPPSAEASWDHYARILTAKDFPLKASSSSSSSSSSASSVTKANNSGTCGSKRTAETPSSPPGRPAISQVVGWPPVRNYRTSSNANHSKSPVTEDFFSTADICKGEAGGVNKTDQGSNSDISFSNKRVHKTSLFVKVNMDGVPIGRKVDLSAHRCYETLAHALDDMFKPSEAVRAKRFHLGEKVGRPSRLLDSSSDFVLTYEDKDGDWMLVGDVPWELFMNSVRRLRIMRTTEANGLALGSH